jgi:hypothetical protein
MDSCEFKGPKKEEPSPSIDDSAHTSNIFQSAWIRRFICADDEMDRFLSGNRYYLLLRINPLFLLVLFLIKEKVMNH